MRSQDYFDLLGEPAIDSKNRPVRLIEIDGVLLRYYVGPDAHGFILKDEEGEYIRLGNEIRRWRGIIDAIPSKDDLAMIGEFNFLSIKPDAFQRSLDGDILFEIDSCGLNVVRRVTVRINKSQLFRLYPYFFESEWEAALVRYFCSSETLFLLVTGEDAVRKGLNLRKKIRSNHRNMNAHPVVNLMHSSDSREEAYREALIFFGGANEVFEAIGLKGTVNRF